MPVLRIFSHFEPVAVPKNSVVVAILFIFLLTGTGYSQNPKDFLDKGDRFFAKKDYQNALEQYMMAYDKDPESPDANFRVGLTYLYQPEKSKALNFLEKAYSAKPEVDADIDYHIGLAYQHTHQYRRAIEHFETFKRKNKKLSDIADHKIHECTIADSLTKKPINVVIENLGNVINTPFHDYSPIVSADGSKLFFTSNRPVEGDNPNRGPVENFEDIYIARNVNNFWVAPQKIGENVNIKFHDAAASLSPDGKTLFLYYEQGSGDIFTSTFDGIEWSKPVPLNKNINTPFWETSACISADGKRLYFTSSRPGGFGELDIYVSELDEKGDWGKAVNLGKTINTPGNEDSPFIHHDGETLYFSSNGHPSMGSNDIFMTKLKDGVWQKPRNLGFPVNSVEYDGFFSISADKKKGFYSTMREDGYGDTDIYSITFLETVELEQPQEVPVLASNKQEIIPVIAPAEQPEKEEEPAPEVTAPVTEKQEDTYVDPIVQLHKDLKIVTLLKGKVVDANSATPLGAIITLVDNQTNTVITRVTSNVETGDFELTIPHGGNYGVSTERTGYLFNSINFNLPQFAEYQEIDTHIIMVKAEVGSKAVLKNIFFDTGKSDLKPESISELENILELLQANPHLKVQINGHTDNVGDDELNKALSLKRATSVVNHLIEKGISPDKLSAVGYGEERPLVSNDDEMDGREINRRTEIEIIEAN